MVDRRGFVAAAAGAIVGLPAVTAIAQREDDRGIGKIGLQLYTVRGLMKENMARTLAEVARAGYSEVEFAGYFNHPAREVRRMLDDTGLTSPSAHLGMADIGEGWGAFLDDANTLGQKYLTVTWIDAPDRTLRGYRKIAEKFNAAGTTARRHGVHLAYHNYTYEFAPVDGIIPYELLLRECEPGNLAMEADIFWMRKAGQDPLAWFRKYPGRFHMLHVKDMGPPPANEMVDVGKGVIDWRAVLSQGKGAGVRHVFVEHDEPADPLASIRTSHDYLSALRL